MKKEIKRYTKFMLGIIFCSLGIILILKSHLGLAPWDVLNQGINRTTGITIGRSNTLVGLIAMAISLKYKQPMGSGTILNLFLVGEFMDVFNKLFESIPTDNFSYLIKLLIFVVGVICFSYGCFLYIREGVGCGPRDGLLVALAKATPYSVSTVKSFLEASALLLGYFLGGTVGIGSIIFTVTVGPVMQFFFKIHSVDIKEVYHRSIKEELKILSTK